MFHGISIVVQGSTVRQSSDKYFLMPLSLVCDMKMGMLDLKKGNLSKYARQRWRTLHLIDIDQVKNINFLDKIQKGLVVLVVISITSTLRWFIVSCSAVFINSKRKYIAAIYMYPNNIG